MIWFPDSYYFEFSHPSVVSAWGVSARLSEVLVVPTDPVLDRDEQFVDTTGKIDILLIESNEDN